MFQSIIYEQFSCVVKETIQSIRMLHDLFSFAKKNYVILANLAMSIVQSGVHEMFIAKLSDPLLI